MSDELLPKERENVQMFYVPTAELLEATQGGTAGDLPRYGYESEIREVP